MSGEKNAMHKFFSAWCRAQGHEGCTIVHSKKAWCRYCREPVIYYECTSGTKVFFTPYDVHEEGGLHAKVCKKMPRDMRAGILKKYNKHKPWVHR